MKKEKRFIPWIFVGLFIVLVALTCRVTIIPDEVPETMVNAAGETVTVEKLSVTEQYCVDNWDSKIIPAIHERAVDAPQFLQDVTVDLNAAGEKYGNRANETSAWSFCVKGEAKVVEIENADKPNKTNLLLDLPPYDGSVDMKLHFGKVFPSNIKNAIRDGVGFLRLDDFANQVEFADLTTAFNNRVKNSIILEQNAQDFLNKTVSFYGCVSLQDAKPDSLVIIPVGLKVVEE